MRRTLPALMLFSLVAPVCGEEPPRAAATRAAVDRSLEWLRRNPAPDDARLAERGMDIWAWNLVARLHPESSVRDEAAARVRGGLRALAPPRAPDWIALSWWAVVLRCADSRGVDTRPIKDALRAADLEAALARSAPTTAWWSSQLLRHAGLEVDSSQDRTAIAERFARRADYRPLIRDAYAFYHELAAATDFGRRPLDAFTVEQLDFVRATWPQLEALAREQADTEAMAELVLVSAWLGDPDRQRLDSAIDWLLGRQLDDGTFLRKAPARDGSDTRHAVLVATWALLVYLPDF